MTCPEFSFGKVPKSDGPPPAHVCTKYLYFFVLFLFCYVDDFRDNFNITFCTNIVVVRPMRYGGYVADVDIIPNIQYTEPAITCRKMNRPQDVFMALAGLEA